MELRQAVILFVFVCSSNCPGCSAGGKGEGVGVSRSQDVGVGVEGVMEGRGHLSGPHGRWCHWNWVSRLWKRKERNDPGSFLQRVCDFQVWCPLLEVTRVLW